MYGPNTHMGWNINTSTSDIRTTSKDPTYLQFLFLLCRARGKLTSYFLLKLTLHM